MGGSDDGASASALLRRAAAGDERARSDLFQLLYAELRARARAKLGPGTRSLEATELVHEVFLRLTHDRALDVKDRAHFMVIASKAMRQVLIDRFRRRAQEPHAGLETLACADFERQCQAQELDLEALGEALEELERRDTTLARLVDLRFFVGLSMPECAEVLGTPLRSLERRWEAARAWLYARIG